MIRYDKSMPSVLNMARTKKKYFVVFALSFIYDKGLINAKWLTNSFYPQSKNLLYPDRVQRLVGLICLQPVYKDFSRP